MQALETGRKASIQQTFRAYLTSAHRFYFYWQYIVFILQWQKVLNTTSIWLKRTETNTVLIVFKGVSFPSNLQYTCICFFLFSVHSSGARNRKLLYVIQLSDRVYNVTLPALGIYILSRECHIIYPVWWLKNRYITDLSIVFFKYNIQLY